LKKYTEYIVWVVAYNYNGAGANSEEVTVRTLSDVPSEPPTNVTLEAASSTVSNKLIVIKQLYGNTISLLIPICQWWGSSLEAVPPSPPLL
jgi:hypothetical protein